MINKTNVRHLIAAGTMLVIGAANASAQMYLNGEVGAAFAQDVTIKNTGGAKASFNPGVRGGFALGYNLSDSFAAEFESGVIWNSMDTLGGMSVSDAGATIDLYQIPFLANLVYKTPVKSGFSGYIGAGVGGVASILDVSAQGNNGNDTDFTFAYQGMAGVKYAICKNMDVGVAYKFLGTLDHSWNIGGGGLSTEALYTHSVLATFTFRF